MIIASEARRYAIDRTRLLGTDHDPTFDCAARIVAGLLRTPIAHTTLVLRDRQFFPSFVGMPEPIATTRETPLTHSLCRHVVAADRPVAWTDTQKAPELADNLAVLEFGVRTYVGVPLRDPQGVTIGAVCGSGFEPREWTNDEIDRLQDVASWLRSYMTHVEEIQRLREMSETDLGNGLIARALDTSAQALTDDPRTDVHAVADRLHDLASALRAF